jgi:hypothetical protein
MIFVPVVVTVVVAPGPVFLLLLWTKLAEVTVAVAMVLIGPPTVVHNLVVVPHVIVSVVGIINAIVMMLAGDSGQR